VHRSQGDLKQGSPHSHVGRPEQRGIGRPAPFCSPKVSSAGSNPVNKHNRLTLTNLTEVQIRFHRPPVVGYL